MKKEKWYALIIIILIVTNSVFFILYIHEKNNDLKYKEPWDLALNNAVFCFEQYDENDLEEGYYFAIGEIGTLANLMGSLNNIDESKKQYFGSFYECLVTESESMKLNIPQIRKILNMLQDNDDKAYIHIKELVNRILNIK